MGSYKTRGTEILRDLVRKHPDKPARTLARIAYELNPGCWKNLESARTAVRTMVGATGKARRDSKIDKSLFRDPRPAGWGCTIPDAVVQLAGWKAFDIPGKHRTLILSDVHIPFHSTEALELALDYGREKKCTLILLNGDIADHYSISRWQTDPGLRDFPGEVLAIKKFLGGLRKNFPKARIIYKHGNHEERYSVFMQHKCPEFLGLEQFEWGNVFALPENKVELVHQKRPISLGKLNVIHGHEYPGGISAPVNPARGLFLRGKCHAICGHLHQSSQHSEKTLEQSVVSTWSTGCLCDLNPDYRPMNNWNHGFAFAETAADGSFEVQNLRVIDGKVY
jgi:predicted phosphodiesterase